MYSLGSGRPPLPPPLTDPSPIHLVVQEEDELSYVKVADVASVGNASDTLVSVDKSRKESRSLHEAAKLALHTGNCAGALALFESILQAQERRFGPHHASVAAAMHNVGVCRQRMGAHDLAEDLFRRAVELRVSTCGEDSLEVAASLSKLGSTRVALGKLDDALVDLRRAIRISREVGVLKTQGQVQAHLACLYFEAGELLAAQATFEDALEIFVSCNEKKQITDALCNIGWIQNRRKQHTRAIATFTHALELETQEDRRVQTLDNLAYSYSKAKDYARACRCYQDMRRYQLRHYGVFNEACLESFRKQLLMHDKLRESGLEECVEVLQCVQTMLPPEHAIVIQVEELVQERHERYP